MDTASTKNANASAVDAYLASLAPGSRRTMLQALDSVAKILDGDGPEGGAQNFHWPKVTPEQANQLRLALSEKFAVSTANKMLSAFRGVIRKCRDLNLIDEQRYPSVSQLKMLPDHQEKLSRTLSVPEMRMLFAVCADDVSSAGRRDAAILGILFATAARRVEATQIDLQDYDPKTGRLSIRSEVAERVRSVILNGGAKAALHDWLKCRSQEPGPLLLPVDRGGTIRMRRLTDQAIYLIVERLGDHAGIPGLTTRDLRRTCISRMISAGMSLNEVRAAVGHMSWLTTAAYRDIAVAQSSRGKASLTIPFVKPRMERGRE